MPGSDGGRLYCPGMIEDTACWPSGTVRIVWHDASDPELPLTGAHGFCLRRGQVLVCDVPGRGLAIPGGHIETGETAADCLKREALEEACVRLTGLRLVGFVEADHRGNRDYDGRYPLRSVQAIYLASVAEVEETFFRHESTGRQFVNIDTLPDVHHEWNAVLEAALRAAMDMHES